MPKICPGCGSQQNDYQQFCSVCGTDLTNVPSSENYYSSENNAQPNGYYQNDPDNYAPYSYNSQYTPDNQQPPKKKSKAKFFIIGGIAAVVIAAVVCCLFFFPVIDTDTSTDNSGIVFSKSDTSYYVSPIMFKLNGEDDPTLITTENEKYGETYFHTDRYARIGSTIYCIDTRYGQSTSDYFTKVTFSSDNKLTETPWVESDLTEHCSFTFQNSSKPSEWVNTISRMATDGESVYFNINKTSIFISSSIGNSDIPNTFGKISLDGKSIEPIAGINATDFVMDNEWIYYFDNGSSFDGIMFSKLDTENVGIYKAKPDGSEKQRIYEFTFTNNEKMSYSSYLFDICGRMQLINDQIYFLDYTSTGNGRVYRMDKDGSNAEPVSKSATYTYTVNPEQNIVYYYVEQNYKDNIGVIDNPTDINAKFCKYDIASDTETEIPHANKGDKMDLVYENGYLYFFSDDFEYGNDSHAKSGLRMDTATEKMQWLVAYQEGSRERVTNPDTGKKEFRNNGERHCYWEDAETKMHKEE